MSEQMEKRTPRHVAVIMDGNGRWAAQRGLPRTEGHRVGAARVKDIAHACLDLKIEYLTVYAFSKENWKRPKREVSSIMRLTEVFFRREFNKLRNKGVYFVHVGDRTGLPGYVTRVLDHIDARNTEDKKLSLNIAFNYSGRNEITEACRKLCSLVKEGEIDPSSISEKDIQRFLYTADMPDPDLLIRTGGEFRVSNFLLWQIAYTELWVTDVLWPDFSAEIFKAAIKDYTQRERRFGRVDSSGGNKI
jgi:undecaprenyl diphosphate synthase